MEISTEVVIWFLFSVSAGILLFSVIINFDYENFTEVIEKITSRENKEEENILDIKNYSFNEVTIEFIDFWRTCNFGKINQSKVLFYTDSQEINQTSISTQIKDFNLCHVLGSNTTGCGYSSELNISSSISGPKFINLYCNVITRQLEIK